MSVGVVAVEVGVPATLVVLGGCTRLILGKFKSVDDGLAAMGAALAEHSRALALLVEDKTRDNNEMMRTRERLHSLENATTYLRGVTDLYIFHKQLRDASPE